MSSYFYNIVFWCFSKLFCIILYRVCSLVCLAWLLVSCGAQDSSSDRGYCFPASTILVDGAKYEYIVVGAGASGAAVAARLALAGHHVLLVEAGSDPDLVSRTPGAAMGLLGGPLDWQYDTLSNGKSCLAYRNQQCRLSRGRCLGGSTSINYMMYTRGAPQDFDDLGIPGWSWNDVRPYFLRYEGMQDLDRLPASSIPYHNTTGTMRVGFFGDSENPWHSRLFKAYQALNIPNNPDVNAPSQIGVTQVVGYVFDNERMSTARGYLARPDVKSRLKVAKLTRCTGVILDDNNEAKGIKVVQGLVPLSVYATKEVILSAGALATPQILMLSGIGPAEHLQKMNIPVKLDLPVGDSMTDHAFPLLFIKCDYGIDVVQSLLSAAGTVTQLTDLLLLQSGPLTTIGLTDVSTFINTNCYDLGTRKLVNNSSECALPNLQIIHALIEKRLANVGGPLFQHGTDLNDDVVQQLQKINLDYSLIVFSPLLLRPRSKGTVRLASSDPLAPPAIFPNYLSDVGDLEDMVTSLKILEQVLETSALGGNGASIVRLRFDDCPAPTEEGYWACYCRQMTHSTYHAVGTTRVGATGGVVDPRMRVRGARRLRVADLGVMPHLVRANTAATAIAFGELLADFIANNDE